MLVHTENIQPNIDILRALPVELKVQLQRVGEVLEAKSQAAQMCHAEESRSRMGIDKDWEINMIWMSYLPE